jgi:poly(A) polymerase
MMLPPADWRERPGLRRLLEALDAADGTTKVVGGAIRDTLLGLPVADVDLATRLRPEEVVTRVTEAGMKAVPTGIAHGTITAVTAEGPVEVTTLRRDVATDGRHAEVAFTDDWQADASRRDFTINALYADPIGGTVDDWFGGLDDLAARRVRFIGDPLARIAEDHLRILRFFRFHARFGGGEPDEAALAACTERRNDLLALSRERKADELLKLLALPDPAPTVTLMATHGILACLLPEAAEEAIGRLARLVARERAFGVPPARLRRLAALLPRDPAGADAAGGRLRLSNNARATLRALASPPPPGRPPRRLAAEINGADPRDLFLLADIGEDELAGAIASLSGWRPPEFPIKGGDIVALGLRPGPQVAALLAQLRRGWIEADFPDKAWLRARAKQLVDQALRDKK